MMEQKLDNVPSGKTITIVCRVERESPYGKSFITNVNGEQLIVQGVFTHDFHLGSYYEVTGKYRQQGKYRYLDLQHYTLTYPTTNAEIFQILSRLCPTNDLAKKLMDKYEDQVLFLLEKPPLGDDDCFTPEEKKDLVRIQRSLSEKRKKEPIVRVLEKLSLSPTAIVEFIKKYRLEDLAVLETNPYAILDMTEHLKFKTVDDKALAEGYPIDGAGRLKALALYCLRTMIFPDGHTVIQKAVAEQEFVSIASVPIGYFDTKKILKAGISTNDAPRKLNVGGYEVTIDVKHLRKKLAEWEAKPKTKRPSFSYPLLEISEETVRSSFDDLISDRKIYEIQMNGEPFYQLAVHHFCESSVAKKLKTILRADKTPYPPETVKQTLSEVLAEMEKTLNFKIELEPEQEQSVLGVCSTPYGASILTGPAGSGKTFVLKIIVKVLERLREQSRAPSLSTQILAPTGRAAQVAQNATKLNASTIHRFFKIGPDKSKAIDSHSVGLYIVDEFSMVDIYIFSQMLSHVQGQFKMVFVGDTEQLPSVEAGSCLRDLIASQIVPHFHLKTAKRQASGSAVLINANKIIRGESIATEIVNEKSPEDNAYIIYCGKNDEQKALDTIRVFSQSVGLTRFQNEIAQILCPTKNGVLGTQSLNLEIQKMLNPYTENPIASEGQGFDRIRTEDLFDNAPLFLQIHDKVINTANAYELDYYDILADGNVLSTGKKGVFNGEMGVITAIYRANVSGQKVQRVTVKFSDGYVNFDGPDIFNLKLAYAITIHKSQGSQWPIVASPLLKFYDKIHTRQLLYTMYTRTEKTCYLIGEESAIDKAICNPSLHKRLTGLEFWLRAEG